MAENLEEKVKELEKELNYLRQYKEALDKTTIISKTDPNGNITDVNEMFEKISGYTKEELLGKPHNVVRHPDMPKSFFKKMWHTIQNGKIFKGVVKNRKKDGSEYYVLANVVPIKDENGNIKEYIAIRHDVTKRVQLHKEQERFIKRLIKYFLKKLKNPNFTINKYSSLIEEELSKENPNLENIKKFNKEIKREALTLQRVYNNLEVILEFKEQKVEVKIEPINILKVLQYLYKKHAKYYNKKVTFKVNDSNIIINTDKKLFVTMIENLFVNSLTYAKSEINIQLFKKEKDIYLIIEHDGKVIQNRKKIFDFFNQLKHSSEIDEIGIGMFNVRKIINLFEYDIKLKEKEGKNVIMLRLSYLPPKKLL